MVGKKAEKKPETKKADLGSKVKKCNFKAKTPKEKPCPSQRN